MARKKDLRLIIGCSLLFAAHVQAGDLRLANAVQEKLNSIDPIKAEIKLRQLKQAGVNAIEFSPLAYQQDVNYPMISYGNKFPPEMIVNIEAARRLDLKVFVKPLIVIPSATGKEVSWRAAIRMDNEEDWRDWFDNYEQMITQYAGLAQRLRADVFVLGAGYERATAGRDRPWRKIIHSVRAIFTGQIAYEARSEDEAKKILFADELNALSIHSGQL